jgi:predicted metal-binding protein
MEAVLDRDKQMELEELFVTHGFDDYKWIDPKQIVVAQWVRVKCMFGCPNYGRKGACPPQTPSVAECERFFQEYKMAVVFHKRAQFDPPEKRFAWYKKTTLQLSKLERAVFLAGHEKTFGLSFAGCSLCKECMNDRTQCRQAEIARPSPEAMAMDVYSTVRNLGYPIEVRTDQTQHMDRYFFLMID